jgi:hypothetical protein
MQFVLSDAASGVVNELRRKVEHVQVDIDRLI